MRCGANKGLSCFERCRRVQPAALAEGWMRVYVLESEGWCKDMDLYTKDGMTVGPLPTSGRDESRRDALHARYNTRLVAGE